ncbi:hypothetical protein [Gymnodinialimonas sp.]
MILRFVHFVAILMMLAASVTSAYANQINLTADEVLCLIEHSDVYLIGDSDPIVFLPAACPEVDLEIAISSFTEATGIFPAADQGNQAVIMALTREEFNCLLERLQTLTELPYSVLISDVC